MRLDHAIFQGPLRPKIELGSIETPGGYRHWAGGEGLPAQLPSWKVQDGELGKTVDYGLVSDPVGFEDSPDAEWISSGVNSKGPNSMAIGRHGNWFLWGFSGDPTQMTESARCVFVNSIVWMRQFDGKRPLQALERERKPGRDSVFNNVSFLRSYAKDANLSSYLRDQFPPELFQQTGGDPDKLRAYYQENLEYLVPHTVHRKLQNGERTTEYDAQQLEPDPALVDHGVSNRSLELFDLVVRLLKEHGPDDATAAELRSRYFPKEAPADADALQKWVAANRAHLYFSDVYGYRWFVAPSDLPVRPTAPTPTPPAAAGGG